MDENGTDYSTEQLRRCLGSVTVVEALGPPYFASGHIPGAVNLPPHRVAELAPATLPDTSAPIVVYGGHDGAPEADVVIRRLRALGYEQVHRYPAGKEGWACAGLPLTSGEQER